MLSDPDLTLTTIDEQSDGEASGVKEFKKKSLKIL